MKNAKKQFNKLFLLFMTVTLTAVMALTGCENKGDEPSLSDNTEAGSEITDIGEGETTFAFEVTDDKGELTKFTVHTEEQTVGAALSAIGLIEGEETEFGLNVKAVNGLTADFDTDKAYWAFYIDGEYAMSGVDATAIETDKSYAFVYTKE